MVMSQEKILSELKATIRQVDTLSRLLGDIERCLEKNGIRVKFWTYQCHGYITVTYADLGIGSYNVRVEEWIHDKEKRKRGVLVTGEVGDQELRILIEADIVVVVESPHGSEVLVVVKDIRFV